MASILQQTLRGLCYDTGWCYAVFWKLQRQIRTVLTWEDGFYEQPTPMRKVNSLYKAASSSLTSGPSGQQMIRFENLEDQIGLAVAKMSCHVYSVGEGIIGQVAFTRKHQWIAGSDKVVMADWVTSSMQNSWTQEEYLAAWQTQFTAGIKTVAVIAVPQGVVQLGSTEMISEDLNLVEHVKTVFETLQHMPAAFFSDVVSEAQRGRRLHSVSMSAPPLASMGSGGTHFGQCGMGRLPMFMASRQLNTPLQSTPAAGVLGRQVNKVVPQHFFPQKLGSNSLVQAPLALVKSTSTTSDLTEVKPPSAETPSRTGIIGQFALATTSSCMDFTSSGSSTILPFAGKLNSETATKLPGQNMTVPIVENPHFIGNISSAQCNVARLVERAKDSVGQVEARSQSGGSICFVNNDLPNSDSLVLDSGAPIFSQESLQPLAVRSVGNNFTLARFSSHEGQGHSQVYESQGLYGGWGGAVAESHSPLLKLLSQVETKSSHDDTSSSCFDLQISDLAQLTEHLDNADELDYGNCISYEKVDLELKSASTLFCEDSIEDVHSFKATLEKPEPCIRFLSGNLDGRNALSTELEDFDDFIALLAREKDKQNGSFSTVGPGFTAGDELSEAWFPVCKKLPQKVCFEEASSKQAFEVIDIEGDEVSVTKADDKEKEMTNFHAIMGCATLSGMLDAKPEPLSAAVVAGVSSIKPVSLNCDSTSSSVTGTLSVPICPPGFLKKPCESTSVQQKYSNELQRDRCKEMHMVETVSCAGLQNLEDDDAKMFCQKAVSLLAGKQDDSVKTGKKRARPGETGRPRPKDRQQIQDRIRELRDIIPNATKCSIDSLLERTIKYMSFLQTGTTQGAGKWNKNSKLQSIGCNHIEPELNGNKGGASWAVELGRQGMGCPIIVENLYHPRQLLVEILYEEKGTFLEIPDSIRGLGLTILRGIMEARNNKIWAQFVVEAVEDVERVKVLCSLMQLLQPDTRSSADITQSASCAWSTTH